MKPLIHQVFHSGPTSNSSFLVELVYKTALIQRHGPAGEAFCVEFIAKVSQGKGMHNLVDHSLYGRGRALFLQLYFYQFESQINIVKFHV